MVLPQMKTPAKCHAEWQQLFQECQKLTKLAYDKYIAGPNDFLMFSAVNEEWLFNSLEEGVLVHCTKVVTCTVIKNLGIGMLEL